MHTALGGLYQSDMNPVMRFLKWLYEFAAWVGEKLDELYEEDKLDHIHWSEEDF